MTQFLHAYRLCTGRHFCYDIVTSRHMMELGPGLELPGRGNFPML